ncbi:MAG: primase, primase protein [Candidatus Parcubacteria bacterium]|jgi:DNA primase
MSTPVEQIKEKLSIVDVVSAYVKLDRSGIYFKAKCPFHNERTPSFMLSPARNTYHCFGCGKGGDIFSFVQEIEGLDFPATLKMLAEKAGIVLDGKAKRDGGEKAMLYDVLEAATKFYEGELRKSKTAIDYLKSRGITGETAKTFRIGFAPDGWENLVNHLRQKGWQAGIIEKAGLSIPGKSGRANSYDRFRNRIMFPISSTQGKPVAFTGRIMPDGDAQMGKYVNSPETALYHKSSILYGLDLAKSAILKNSKVIVVEGQMDAIMIHQAGNTNVVAVSGTALTDEHLQLLKRFTDSVVFCFDNDNAGQAALRKAAMLAFTLGLETKAIALTEKDPADVIKENPEAWTSALKNAEPVIDYLMLLAKRHSDSPREQIRKVKEEVLPLIVALPGNMEQSYYMKKVSEMFDLPEASVRDDLKKLMPKTVQEVAPTETSPPLRRTAREEAAERVVGFEKVFGEKVNVEKIRLGFMEAMKVPIESFTASLPEERIPSLTLEAELYYSGSDKLEKISEELIATLLLANYEELLSDTLRKMRQAEQEKKGSEAQRLHAESKDIGDKIYQIKNNRQSKEL